jgi:hypothetical protein
LSLNNWEHADRDINENKLLKKIKERGMQSYEVVHLR